MIKINCIWNSKISQNHTVVNDLHESTWKYDRNSNLFWQGMIEQIFVRACTLRKNVVAGIQARAMEENKRGGVRIYIHTYVYIISSRF